MNSHLKEIARICWYLITIAMQRTTEAGRFVARGAANVGRTLAILAAGIVGIAGLLFLVAFISRDSAIIGFAVAIITFMTLLLHWTSRPFTFLVDQLEIPNKGLVRAWHRTVIGILLSLTLFSMFLIVFPVATTQKGFVLVALSLLGLSIVGERVPVLGGLFKGVTYAFLILTFLGVMISTVFDDVAVAAKRRLGFIDRDVAAWLGSDPKETQAHVDPTTPDGPEPTTTLPPPTPGPVVRGPGEGPPVEPTNKYIEDLRQRAQLQPRNASLHLEIAAISEKQGDTGGALRAFEAALAASPGNATASAGIARLRRSQ